MKRNLWRLLLGSAILGTCAALAAPVQVTTHPTYYPGERLEILITATQPGVLNFSSSLQTMYALDNYHPLVYSIPVLTQVTTPYTWSWRHRWELYNLLPGIHTVDGIVYNYGSGATTLQVLPTPVPPGDFVVDFETIPGTTARVDHLMAYDGCGVHFHTSLGANCSLDSSPTNSAVKGFDPYPTGFNVAASLDKPVFAASAKVAGGTGVRITMTARNAAGQILASDTCAPITQPGQFAQELSVKSVEPIVSLEWWPSQSNSMCDVDDILLVNSSPVIRGRNVGNNFEVSWFGIQGATYNVWSSEDLQNWSQVGLPWTGTGSMLIASVPLEDSPARFFRVSRHN